MVIDMNDEQLHTLGQMQSFLDGTVALELVVARPFVILGRLQCQDQIRFSRIRRRASRPRTGSVRYPHRKRPGKTIFLQRCRWRIISVCCPI
jgi:hypothetical protein